MWKRSLGLVAILLLAASCGGNMVDQPKYTPLRQLGTTACAQPLPDGVVARDAVVDQPALTTGSVNDQPIDGYPMPLTADMLQRGRDRYQIFCRPCHGASGNGDGVVTFYGFPALPSLYTNAITSLSTGEIFDVITNGLQPMPAYRQQIPVADRWAIVAYVEALQLSQHVPAASLPNTDREQLPQ